jgi:hypothetical protein
MSPAAAESTPALIVAASPVPSGLICQIFAEAGTEKAMTATNTASMSRFINAPSF